MLRGGGLAGLVQGDGWVLVEDAVDLANWMVDAEEIPLYPTWNPDAAAAAQAEAINSMGEGFL